jgi:putative endonuclease
MLSAAKHLCADRGRPFAAAQNKAQGDNAVTSLSLRGGVTSGKNSTRHQQMKHYYVYIMTNRSKTLYTGVTNNLQRRVYEHKHHLIAGFTSTYLLTRLVYVEETSDVNAAIAREKHIKGWVRAKKMALIKSINPDWRDLSEE